MKWEVVKKPKDPESVRNAVAFRIEIEVTDDDLMRTKIHKAVREWYDHCEHTFSDELFYLSEMVKGLEEAKEWPKLVG